jgi:hypothetical protein
MFLAMTLRGLTVQVVIIAALALCAQAFADGTTEKKTAKNSRIVKAVAARSCVVRFGGSVFPEPCDRVGEMPATAEPMRIIGKLPTTRDAR